MTSKPINLVALPGRLGLTAVIAMSPENFAYASGAHIITMQCIRPRHSFVLLADGGEAELIVCSIETSLAREESWIERITEYTEFADDPVAVLADRLRARGLTKGRIGIDLDYLPKAAFDRLAALLPQVDWVDTSGELARLRARKVPCEIEALEKACHATHSAVLEAMQASRLGDTERQMSGRIFQGLIERGANGILFLCFISGDRIFHSHGSATDRVPAAGELIRFDVAARWDAWSSDFARTYSAGDPTPLQLDHYRKLSEVQEETIEFIRPGVTADAVFHRCRDGFLKRNLPFHMPHVGHSFGHELHESPMLRPGEDAVIEEGMVLNIEPALADAAGNFFHLEDLIEIRADGPRLLSKGLAPRVLPVIGEAI